MQMTEIKKAVNLVLRPRGAGREQDRAVAKCVRYGGGAGIPGGWMVHAWVQPKYQRHDIGAWGINQGVMRWAREHGAPTIALYDKKNDMTYWTTLEVLEAEGVTGEPDEFGGNVNLPVGRWASHRGRLPLAFIPDHTRVVVPWDE
jgi:hypothetical protein